MRFTGLFILGAMTLSSISPANAQYVFGISSKVRSQISEPAVGQSYVDPDFGGIVTRLTDAAVMGHHNGMVSAVGDQTHGISNEYSRVRTENADGSKVLLLHYESAADPTYDGGLKGFVVANPDGSNIDFITFSSSDTNTSWLHDEVEPRWHPTNPNKIRFIEGQNSYTGSLKLFEYDILTRAVSVLSDLSGKLPWTDPGMYGMSLLEGDSSKDGNRFAWVIENASEETVGYVAFDIRNGGEVLGTMDADDRGADHIGMAPNGDFVVVSYSGARTGPAAYPVDFSSERVLHSNSEHSDLCINAAGNSCYVFVDFDDSSSDTYGWVVVTDLVTHTQTKLINVFVNQENASMHLSGRAFNKPGWVLMSTYNCNGNGVDPSTVANRLCDRLVLVELESNPQIVNLAWANASGQNAAFEPHATINQDGTRAYFGSDFYGRDLVDTYALNIDASAYNGGSTSGGDELNPDDTRQGNVTQAEWERFTLAPSSQSRNVIVDLEDLTADGDLYVRLGQQASTSNHDCKSEAGQTSDEQCVITVPANQILHIGVYGYQATNYTLKVFTDGGGSGSGETELTPGDTHQSNVALGEWGHFTLAPNSLSRDITVDLEDLTADGDLYVRLGQQASTSNHDCKSEVGQTNDEQCVITVPANQTLHIGVYGYQATNYTLKAVDNGGGNSGGNMSLSSDQTSYSLGATVTISFSGATTNGSNWVGIYSVGADNSSASMWLRTDGSQGNNPTGPTDGQLSFDSTYLSTGQFEARLFFNDSYDVEQVTAPFTIGN